MKDNFLHICFIIDSSGSMYGSKSDVIGGFKQTIDEQKSNKNGDVSVSLFTFNDTVTELYLGKDINDIKELDYNPNGMTAMNDGIGVAIDKVGKWLNDMDENQRPSKNLIIIMTDGKENSSREYKLDTVKEMIKHQEEKYNWSFVYMGTDITSSKDADNLGIKVKTYGSREMFKNNYDIINKAVNTYRCCSVTMDSCAADAKLAESLIVDTVANTELYESQLGTKIKTD